MFFSSVFLKSLRDYRVAILGWGIGMGLTIVSPMASVATLISTPQARATLASLAQQFKWAADPVAAGTIGGYATFKIGIFILLMAVWPLLVGSRTLRGEEERGSLDVLLSVPRTRLRVAIEKVAAMWIALLAMGAIIGVLAYLGGVKFKADFSLVDGLVFGLNLALICAVFGALALFISQFTQERGTASGITAGLLLIFIVIDMVHRVIPNTDWFSHLSPIYYYNLSKPLIPSYGTSAGGILVQLALVLVLTVAGIALFVRRDLGAPVRLPRSGLLGARSAGPSRALPVTDWSLRSIYSRSMAMLVMPTFWWTLGIAGYAAWMVVVVQQLAGTLNQLLASSPNSAKAIKALEAIGGGASSLDAVLLAAMFELLPVLLMAFVVTQVNRWASDHDEGRLEIVLSTPQPRINVLLGRFAALATATAIVGVVTLLAVAVASAIAGVTLSTGNLAEATLGMVPLGLLIAAVGYLAAGWLRTAADTGLLSFLLAGWFFLSFIGPDLKWPDTTLRLSPFYYYGTPLLHGIQLGNLLVVVVVGAAALLFATLRFSRRDIGV
ncbi:MAG TPA: ABC transporter permease subunit [Candidatus Dormibacteraeota bacterium]|nr:ABC transporter permease subunit [Candidatus Dormibacteraeota bacterium]